LETIGEGGEDAGLESGRIGSAEEEWTIGDKE
jgi:hypothetical protein